MSGNATFSGTTHQAGVIAFVAAHVLTETKLRWLPVSDDTPSAVSGEVKGPGDDARVEFAARIPPIEVQAKHGLKGPKAVEDVLQTIRDASAPGESSQVVLAVDSTSSASIRNDLRSDLDRLRSERTDGLKDITRQLITALGDDVVSVMRRVRILTLDVDAPSDGAVVRAQELLAEHLEDPSQAAAAWGLLQADAARMCADRSRRTRKQLLDLLLTAGIRLRPPLRTRRWHDDLRYSKKLLTDEDPAAVLSLLNQIELDLVTGSPDSEILYRLNQHKAAAYLQMGKFKEAITYAQKALDHNSAGVHALVNLANAQAFNNEIDAARSTAEKAVALHPESPSAWLMRLQLPALPGEPPVVTPSDVASTPEYQRGLLEIVVSLGDGSRARDLAASVIAEGDRSVSVLLLRVDALVMDIDQASIEERLSRAAEMERLCGEILDGTSRLSDRSSQQALVGRSVAKRLLGRPDEALKDIERAEEIRPDDPRMLIEAVQARILAGQEDAALELLNRPTVEGRPFLLAMRAGLLAGRGDSGRARRDLDAVLQALPNARQPDMIRSAAAEVALQLGDMPLARRLLAETSPDHSRSTYHTILLARIAVSEGNLPQAEEKYRQAATLDPAHRADLLAELGVRLLEGKNSTDAVRVFEEAQPLPPKAERAFVRALILVDRLGDALGVLERTAVNGTMPDWAVAYAAQIAIRRNDPSNAAAHLEDLIARGTSTPDGRLILVDTLLTLDKPDRARTHASELIRDDSLTAHERMQLAHHLIRLQEPAKALEMALRAYRQAPHDAEISRAFASAVLFARSKPVEADRIGPNTHAILRTADGKELEYLIFAQSAAHSLPKEIPLEAAERAGLLGLRVGDVFIQDEGAFFEKHWHVEQIQSALKYAFNDVVANYSTRFPSAPFFAVGFQFNPDAPSIADFQPMIDSTQARTRHLKQILDAYRDQVLPLDFVAKMTQVSMPVLVSELSSADSGRPLFVEWSDDEGTRTSRASARLSNPVVLTRSALFTLGAFDLRGLLLRNYGCIAPRSLRDQLRAELAQAEESVSEGQAFMSSGDRGLVFQQQEAGDLVLVRRRDLIRELLEWVDANIEFLPRPLEVFGDVRTLSPEMRSHLGDGANDALELALHTPGTLYADDLGLRRIGASLGIASFSTVSLVQVLAERGVMNAAERDRLLVSLVERHYNAVTVSPELLLEALSPSRTAHALRETFALLAAPAMDAAQAARVLVRAVRLAALMSVRTTTAAQLTRYGLEGMSHRFPVFVTTRLVSQAADEELALLPTDLRDVKNACVQFRKASAAGN